MDYDYDLMGGEDDFYHDFYADNEALGDDEEPSPWREQESIPPMTAQQLLLSCVQPTLKDGFSHLSRVLAWCIIYRLTTQTSMQHFLWMYDFYSYSLAFQLKFQNFWCT